MSADYDGSDYLCPAGECPEGLWLREDGIILDKILLTTDAAYVPDGLGPPASE